MVNKNLWNQARNLGVKDTFQILSKPKFGLCQANEKHVHVFNMFDCDHLKTLHAFHN